MNKNTTSPMSPFLSTHGPEGTSCWCQRYIIIRTMLLIFVLSDPTKWITRWDPIQTRGRWQGKNSELDYLFVFMMVVVGDRGLMPVDGDGDYECACHSTPSLSIFWGNKENMMMISAARSPLPLCLSLYPKSAHISEEKGITKISGKLSPLQ